jgi:hypothetical protein
MGQAGELRIILVKIFTPEGKGEEKKDQSKDKAELKRRSFLQNPVSADLRSDAEALAVFRPRAYKICLYLPLRGVVYYSRRL